MTEYVDCSSYREFMRVRLRGQSTQRVLQRAGIKSKGFLSDLLSGKKRITSRTLEPFIYGLKLSGPLKEVFYYLVLCEEEDLRPKKLEPAEVEKLLVKAKSKLQKRTLVQKKKTPGLFTYQSSRIFSSLCDGASLFEVSEKSGYSEKIVLKHLESFAEKDVIEWNGKTVRINYHFLDQANPDQIQDQFSEYARQMLSKSKSMNDQDLFFCGSVSIDNKRLNEFRSRLRESILSLAKEYECDKGNTKDICLGMY